MRLARVRFAGSVALIAVGACGKTPAPPPPAPVAAPPAQAAAADSAAVARAAAARRDSLAAQTRADSVARANRERARADSVRSQVLRERADTATAVTNPGLADGEVALLQEPIHFDYDKSDLQAADLPKLDRKLQLLQAHPRLEIQIAGNCDERGSDEYNLALGERRAAAAKRYLVAHGIAAGRIGIMSYGKERPLDPGHTEDAWAKNRRDDFAVTRGAN